MAQERLRRGLKFKSIVLLKESSSLGVGAYGSVVKAQCDDLVCAAKIIHPTLVHVGSQLQSIQYEQRLPLRRFETECEFLKDLRHPHIIQYLGMYQDPDTGLPVLLMELADGNLTQALEGRNTFAFQLNISFDVACALSFLHSNSIVHRDLSSNNILIFAKMRAKLSDFGMAKFVSTSSSQISNTIMPGTDVYMPPEALENCKAFTDKGDVFSLGVNMIQILTQRFPSPGDRFKMLHIDHPQVPEGSIQVRVSERERREVHIQSIDPQHPLLPIALDCIKDVVEYRPTASELCHRLTAIKNGNTQSTQETTSMHTEEAAVMPRDEPRETESEANRLEEAPEHDRQLASETFGEKEAELTTFKQQQKKDQRPIPQYENQIKKFDKQSSSTSSSKAHETTPKTKKVTPPPPVPPRILRRTSSDPKPSRPLQYHAPRPSSSKPSARELKPPTPPPRDGLQEPNERHHERKGAHLSEHPRNQPGSIDTAPRSLQPEHPRLTKVSPTSLSPKPKHKFPSPVANPPQPPPRPQEPDMAPDKHKTIGRGECEPLPLENKYTTIPEQQPDTSLRSLQTEHSANPAKVPYSSLSPKPNRKGIPTLTPPLPPPRNHSQDQTPVAHKPIRKLKSDTLPLKSTHNTAEAKSPVISQRSPKPKRKLSLPTTNALTGVEWRRGKNTPIVMSRDTDAIVNGSNVYLRPHRTRKIYVYNSTAGLWSRQIDCLTDNSSLALIDGFLTTVGGSSCTKLLSLMQANNKRTWTERYPSMSNERARCTAVSVESTLIVAGGLTTTSSGLQALKSIEVLNIDLRQWSIAADLPEPIYASSAQVVDDCLYFLGGFDKSLTETRAVYACAMTDLLMSCHSNALMAKISAFKLSRKQSTMWQSIPDAPLAGATCVSFGNKLTVIGGRNHRDIATNEVHVYDAPRNTWCKIEHELGNSRVMCFAVMLHNDTIMVVGGVASPAELGNVAIDSVEFGHEYIYY